MIKRDRANIESGIAMIQTGIPMIQRGCLDWSAGKVFNCVIEGNCIWARLNTCPRAFVRALRQGEVQRRIGSQALRTQRLLLHVKASATLIDQPDHLSGLGCLSLDESYVR
jgi:hypothetical protein